MLSFHLKSGYHHVDIFSEHPRFLAFSWDFDAIWPVKRAFHFQLLVEALRDLLQVSRYSDHNFCSYDGVGH